MWAGRFGGVKRAQGLLLAGALAACGKPSEKSESAVPVVVAVSPVAEGAGAGTGTSFPLRVLYDREAMISLRVGGTLSAVSVHPGDVIPAGAMVAAITPTLQAEGERRAAAEVERLERAARRNTELLPQGAVSEAQREDTQSALAAAQASLRAARYDRASTIARTPFAGLVLARMHEVGETVAPGEPIARVADVNSQLLARAAVAPAVAVAIAPGTTVQVSIAGRAPIMGRVLRKGSAADTATGTIDVDIALPRASGIASGLTGSVAIGRPSAAPEAGGTLLLPAEALVDAKGAQGHVFVVDPANSVARRTAVRLHGLAGDMLRVEGLPLTARVITAGAGFVRDGQKVRVDGR